MKTIKKLSLFLSTLFVLGALSACDPATSSSSSSDSGSNSSSNSSSSSANTGEESYIYPADNFTEWATPISGDGSDYNRFECAEGYYQIDVPAGHEVYYSFSVRCEGQYALYSLDSAEGVTVTRYDATEQYINYDGFEADVLEDNTFYSRVNCSLKHFNAQWRATYAFEAETATTVKVRFVWIDEPMYEPQTIVTNVSAKQIAGVAQDGEAGKTAIPVPYTSEYFFDENCELAFTPIGGGEPVYKKGFYRLGTPQKKGEIIYVAITSAPERLFDKTFANIQYDGNNLSLHTGTAENGDYLVNNYVDFIMNNGGAVDNANGGEAVEGDPNKLCYQNVTNQDGMFPVNAELFEFLNFYVKKNTPSAIDESTSPTAYWLAPCYYYANVTPGTKGYPIALQTGDTEIEVAEKRYVYCSIKETGYYVLSCDTVGASVAINGIAYHAPFAITVEAEAIEEMLVAFPNATPASGTAVLTLESAQGVESNPLPLTFGSVEIAPVKALTANGFKYFVAYEYTATENGELTITLPTTASVEVLGETSENGALTVTVEANGTYLIVFYTESELPFTAEITL